mgnify:CR=1 FL=1
MPPIAIVLIAILAAHYFLAIATIFVLLKDKGVTKAIIGWNLVILLIPILGPAAYWIYRCFAKRSAPADGQPAQNHGQDEEKQDGQ